MSESFPLEDFYQELIREANPLLIQFGKNNSSQSIKAIESLVSLFSKVSRARSLHILAQQKQEKLDILEALKCPKCKTLPTFVINYDDSRDDNFFRFYCDKSGCLYSSPSYKIFDALKSWIDVISKANSSEVKS